MKFTVFLLFGLCCSVLAKGPLATNYDDKINAFDSKTILDQLNEFVNTIIQKSNESIASVVQEVKTIAAQIQTKLKELANQAKNNLIIKQTLEDLEKSAQENEITQKCLDSHREALDALLVQTEEQIRACIENAWTAIQSILDDIQVHIDAAQTNIDALHDVVSVCLETSSNPIGIVVCVAKQANQIGENLYKLIVNIKNAVQVASTKAAEIVNQARECISGVTAETIDKLAVISQEIQKCINDSQPLPRQRFHLN